MKSVLFGLIIALHLLHVAGFIQYHCYFGDLERFMGNDGEMAEFCLTGLPNRYRFLPKGEFLRTDEPDDCVECMCEDDGLSCCECDRRRG